MLTFCSSNMIPNSLSLHNTEVSWDDAKLWCSSRVCMWCEALHRCLRKKGEDRTKTHDDFASSRHNKSIPIHPGLLSLFSNLLKKVLFTVYITGMFCVTLSLHTASPDARNPPRQNRMDLSQEIEMFHIKLAHEHMALWM